MSAKHPYTENDSLLREQMEQFLPEMPDGVWEALESGLDQISNNLQFDEMLREGVAQYQAPVPQGVWQSIQSGLGSGAAGTAGTGLSLAGKWIIGTLVGGSVIGTAVWVSNSQQKIPLSEEAVVIQAPPRQELPEENLQVLPVDTFIDQQENIGAGAGMQTPAVEMDHTTPDLPSNDPVPVPGPRSGNRTNDNPYESEGDPAGGQIGSPDGLGERVGLPRIFINAKDTLLCQGSVYEVLLTGNRYTTWEVFINGISVEKFQMNSPRKYYKMEPERGSWNMEFRWSVPGGRGSISQNVFVLAKPEIGMSTPLDLGGGEYEFQSENGSAVNWWIDGKFHSRGRSCRVKFYDEVPSDHSVAASQRNESGCGDSVYRTFRNNALVRIMEPNIPDVFTPNGDGINDVYRVEIEGYSYFVIRIYNQEKQLVYEGSDPNQGWDGRDRNKGNTINAGFYFCVIEYALAGGEIQIEKRNIQIMSK